MVLLLSAVPSAAAECTEHACTESWSAHDGSCTAGGSERNYARANTTEKSRFRFPVFRIESTNASVETFCVKSAQSEYREIRVKFRTDPQLDDNATLILWSYDGQHCRLDMQRQAPGEDPVVTPIGCPRNTPPPRVPPLFG